MLYSISHTSFLQSNNSLRLLVSEERLLKFQSIRNKNDPWRLCLLSNQDEMMKSYRRLSIDASCKSLLYLGKWLQRRRFLEIDKPETRIAYIYMAAMFVNGSEQNEQS